MNTRWRSPRSRVSLLTAAMVVALMLVGVMASAAQAFEWRVGGQTLAERGAVSETTAASGSSLEITSTILGEETKMSCSAATSGEISKGGSGKDTVTLTSCAFSKPSPKCEVKSPVALAGKFETVEAGGNLYRKYVPVNGEYFAKMPIVNCVIESTPKLTGSLAALPDQSGKELESQPLSFSSAINSAAGAALNLGPQPASISGSVSQKLTGPFSLYGWRIARGPSWGHSDNHTWTVGGTSIGSGSKEILSRGGPVTVAFKALGQNVSFTCSGFNLGQATIGSGGTGTAKPEMTGCAMTQPAGCSVPKTITMESLTTAIVEAGGKSYVLFQPPGGTDFKLPITGCGFLEATWTFSGSFAALIEPKGIEKVAQPFAFSSSATSAAGGNFKVGSETATLTVSETVEVR
jgi:hypothetical protein